MHYARVVYSSKNTANVRNIHIWRQLIPQFVVHQLLRLLPTIRNYNSEAPKLPAPSQFLDGIWWMFTFMFTSAIRLQLCSWFQLPRFRTNLDIPFFRSGALFYLRVYFCSYPIFEWYLDTSSCFFLFTSPNLFSSCCHFHCMNECFPFWMYKRTEQNMTAEQCAVQFLFADVNSIPMW